MIKSGNRRGARAFAVFACLGTTLDREDRRFVDTGTACDERNRGLSDYCLVYVVEWSVFRVMGSAREEEQMSRRAGHEEMFRCRR